MQNQTCTGAKRSAKATGERSGASYVFGHAFCTLEPNSIISYRVTSYYSAENDKGVAWNDPEIGVEWPDVADPQTLSAKDRNQPQLCDLPGYFTAGG